MQGIALYISTPSLTPETLARLQHVFDTARDYPDNEAIPAMPGYIRPVVDARWAEGLSPQEIYARHRAGSPDDLSGFPIVILDERTTKDESVLVFSQSLMIDDDGKEEDIFKAVRFEARRVPGAAINLQICNQDLSSYEGTVDADGIWRRFP